MFPALAFERDPMFADISNPLLKIKTRLPYGSGCFWIWKTPDFFWFWIEGSPDFFGLFSEGSKSYYGDTRWFEEAANTSDMKRLHGILRHQIHHGQRMRAVSLSDPRPGKTGAWRILWRGRTKFWLQNALTGRAIRFSPETDWRPKSPHWKEMCRLERDSSFFAERFSPLFGDSQRHLTRALDFLELPIEQQDNPLRFRRGNRDEFEAIIRVALMLCYSWPDNVSRSLSVRFHPRTFAPLYDTHRFIHYTKPYIHQNYEGETDAPRIIRLAQAFFPHIVEGFAFFTVSDSPFSSWGRYNGPRFSVRTQGPFSAHDQIEGAVELRLWLAHNAPELLPDWS